MGDRVTEPKVVIDVGQPAWQALSCHARCLLIELQALAQRPEQRRPLMSPVALPIEFAPESTRVPVIAVSFEDRDRLRIASRQVRGSGRLDPPAGAATADWRQARWRRLRPDLGAAAAGVCYTGQPGCCSGDSSTC
jgi:hypothetical protein